MTASYRVIVTGAGSGVGQGIMKALRKSTLNVDVIATDISPFNQGLYLTANSLIMPPVESENALERILAILKAAKPDAIMIGSEFDLKFFAQHREIIEKETGALVIVSDLSSVNIADDKWLTAEFLRVHELPHPRSAVPRDIDEALAEARQFGYPCVLKPRSGTSNRHVHIIRSADQLVIAFPDVSNPVLQELIAEPSDRLANEYTCSVFRCRDGTLLGPFTARRTLRTGNSWMVEVGCFESLHPILIGIGRALPCLGTLNVQLMMGKRGPVPFEFNARFSGTTAVRAYFGFNEPEMSLRNYLLGESLSQPQIRCGMAFRYLEEVFIEGVRADDIGTENLPKGVVVPWF